MSHDARPRRRWFQFSLLSILILTLIAASFFAGLARQRDEVLRLRADLEQAKAEAANLRVARQWEAIKQQLGRAGTAKEDFVRAKAEQAEAETVLENVKQLGREIESQRPRGQRQPGGSGQSVVPSSPPGNPHSLRYYNWEKSYRNKNAPIQKRIPEPALELDRPSLRHQIG